MTSPAPRFDSIDYTRPEDFLFLHPSFVGSGSIADLASRFAVANQEATLGNIWCWLSHFKCVNDTNDYGWRPAIEIIGRRRYIGCADHALVYGCVARACGIPTVWVKSLETAWIRRYRETKVFNGGSGHVFLEMFLAGRWRLVDATQDELFDEYDPNQHLLPGPANHACERYAYDKGADPRALVLSLDWEPWVSETKHYLDSFDLSVLDQAACAVTAWVVGSRGSPSAHCWHPLASAEGISDDGRRSERPVSAAPETPRAATGTSGDGRRGVRRRAAKPEIARSDSLRRVPHNVIRVRSTCGRRSGARRQLMPLQPLTRRRSER